MQHVHSLVSQLTADGDDPSSTYAGTDPGPILQELTQLLTSPSPSEHIRAFVAANGFAAALSMLSAFPAESEALLLAAGAAVKFHQLPADTQQGAFQVQHECSVCWPLSVLQHLVARAVSCVYDVAFAARCMRLLAVGANSLRSHPNALSQLLSGITQAVQRISPTTQKGPPHLSLHVWVLSVGEVLAAACADVSGCTDVITAADKSCVDLVQDVLLPLYSSLHSLPDKRHPTSSQSTQTSDAAGNQGSSQPPPCCRAAHLLIKCMHQLALAVQAVLCKSTAGQPCPQPALLSTPVLLWCLQHVQGLVAQSPPRTQPEHNWAGEVIAFKLGKAAQDPCLGPAGAAGLYKTGTGRTARLTSNSSRSLKSSDVIQAEAHPPSLLQRWVEHLGMVSIAGGTAAAKVLADAGAVQVLSQICELFRQDLALVHAAEATLAQLVLSRKGLMDEMASVQGMHGLIGLVSTQLSSPHGPPATSTRGPAQRRRLQTLAHAALGQLQGLVDTCPGDMFLHLVHTRGLLSHVQAQLWSQLAAAEMLQAVAQPSSKAEPAVVGSTLGTARGQISSSDRGSAGTVGAGTAGFETGEGMLRELCRLYLGCGDRARRMDGVGAHQAPRIGCFAALRPLQLRVLEHAAAQHVRAAVAAQSDPRHMATSASTDSRSDSTHKDSSSSVRHSGTCGRTPGRPSQRVACAREDGSGSGYDSDGIRTKFRSGPTPEVHAARTSWLATDLGQRVSWDQVSDAVHVRLTLPPGVGKSDVRVDVQPDRLSVSLSWAGRVLDGPLARRAKAGEVLWVLERGGSSGSSDVLAIVLPKAEPGRYWKALFEGGPQRSHMELLREAVDADEHVVPYDEMDEGARALVEDVMEKQWQVANGHFDLENSFDDFRLVLGDGML